MSSEKQTQCCFDLYSYLAITVYSSRKLQYTLFVNRAIRGSWYIPWMRLMHNEISIKSELILIAKSRYSLWIFLIFSLIVCTNSQLLTGFSVRFKLIRRFIKKSIDLDIHNFQVFSSDRQEVDEVTKWFTHDY